MTKTEREVWVAAFAAGDDRPGLRIRRAWRAVDALRKAWHDSTYEDHDVVAMLREALAADGGEDG